MSAGVPLALRDLQEWFLNVTTDPVSVDAGIDRHAPTVPPDQLERVVRHGAHETARERLDIYHRSYFSRLTECLADDYSALKFAVGETDFQALCREYIARYPSREPSLNGFGRHLPYFLEETRPTAGRFLPDLARLEWALVEALHAPAPGPLQPEALEALLKADLASASFVANQAARLLSFDYPVNGFFQSFVEGKRPARPERSPSGVLVVRTGYQLWRFEVGPVPAQLLRRLLAGERLGAALEGIDATPAQVGEWFQTWTAHGVFERVIA